MAGELLWLDLEMTGLDPGYHDIVENATVITDARLEVITEGPDLVVHTHGAETDDQLDEHQEGARAG